MASAYGLARLARLTRRQMIAFALISAAINGVMTATVGTWLAHTYSKSQQHRQAIEKLSALVYERRIRAGMVVSSLRRKAELDEVKTRKAAYDEVFVEWNKNVRTALFSIRDVMVEDRLSSLERDFEDHLVGRLARIDGCLTRAYDARIGGGDPLPVLDDCRMVEVYQETLDCGASFLNELFVLAGISVIPFMGPSRDAREQARGRILKACVTVAPGVR
jgi:hypothetical protein